MNSGVVALVVTVAWLLFLLNAAVKRRAWLVDPPRELRWIYLPSMMRRKLTVERTRGWIIALIVASLVTVIAVVLAVLSMSA